MTTLDPVKLHAALQAATARLTLERDCLYESVSNSDGEVNDLEDAAALAELDGLIDGCREALGLNNGTT